MLDFYWFSSWIQFAGCMRIRVFFWYRVKKKILIITIVYLCLAFSNKNNEPNTHKTISMQRKKVFVMFFDFKLITLLCTSIILVLTYLSAFLCGEKNCTFSVNESILCTHSKQFFESSTAHGRVFDTLFFFFFLFLIQCVLLWTNRMHMTRRFVRLKTIFYMLFVVFNFYLFRFLNQLNYEFNSIFEFTFALFSVPIWSVLNNGAWSDFHYRVIINGSASTNNRAKLHIIQPTTFFLPLLIRWLCIVMPKDVWRCHKKKAKACVCDSQKK